MDNDLISRSALLEKAYLTEPATMNNPYGGDYVVKVEDIEAAPAVDAVEVVRCKDCKRWSVDCGTDETVCLKIYSDGAASAYAWQERRPADFCSYGKRGADDGQ